MQRLSWPQIDSAQRITKERAFLYLLARLLSSDLSAFVSVRVLSECAKRRLERGARSADIPRENAKRCQSARVPERLA